MLKKDLLKSLSLLS